MSTVPSEVPKKRSINDRESVRELKTCPQSLINGIASIIKTHSVSPKISNAFLNLLQAFHPGLPTSVSSLFNLANIELRVQLTRVNLNSSNSNDNEKNIVNGQKRIEEKMEEIHRNMTEKFEMLEGLIKESQIKSAAFPVKVPEMDEKEADTTTSLFSKLPIKDLADLEFVEDRLHERRTAINELDNYLSSIMTKRDVDLCLCAEVLVTKVFWEVFLNKTKDTTELVGTNVISVVVDNMKKRFPMSSKETIVDVIREYLRMFEQKEHKPVLKKVWTEEDVTIEEIILDDGGKYLAEESSMDETLFVSTNDSFSSHREQWMEMSENGEIIRHKRRRSFNFFRDPISSREDLQAFEKHLRQDKEAIKEFHLYLDTILVGPNSIGGYVKLIFKAVFATEFLAICRLHARESSQVAMKNTLAFRLIISKVKREFPEHSESRIYASASQFLRSLGFNSAKSKIE